MDDRPHDGPSVDFSLWNGSQDPPIHKICPPQPRLLLIPGGNTPQPPSYVQYMYIKIRIRLRTPTAPSHKESSQTSFNPNLICSNVTGRPSGDTLTVPMVIIKYFFYQNSCFNIRVRAWMWVQKLHMYSQLMIFNCNTSYSSPNYIITFCWGLSSICWGAPQLTRDPVSLDYILALI